MTSPVLQRSGRPSKKQRHLQSLEKKVEEATVHIHRPTPPLADYFLVFKWLTFDLLIVYQKICSPGLHIEKEHPTNACSQRFRGRCNTRFEHLPAKSHR